MAEVVLQVITMVLQRVEPFVLDLPAAATSAHDLLHVVRIDWQIGHPGTVVGGLATPDEPVLDEVHLKAVRAAIERQLVDPFVVMGAAALIGVLHLVQQLAAAQSLDVLVQTFVIAGLGAKDEGESLRGQYPR